MRHVGWVLALSLSFASGCSSAMNDFKQAISQSITLFEQTAVDEWAYQISRIETEEGETSSQVERFDPSKSLSEQWLLVQMDGKTPTAKQQRKYKKNKAKQGEKNQDTHVTIKLRNLIQVESAQLVSDNDQQFVARFEVELARLGKKASKALQGSLVYNKQQQFIERIEITNTASFSPLFAAKIDVFELTLQFIKVGDAVLQHQNDLMMQGTFAFISELNETSTDSFTDYRFVGKQGD